MIKLIKIQRPIIIFPIIFTYFTLINLFLDNFGEVTASELLIPGLIILLLYACIWIVTNHLLKNRTKTAIITTIFFILFFSFGHFYSGLTLLIVRLTGYDVRPLFLNNITWKLYILLIIWIGVFLFFSYIIIRMTSDFRVILQFLNIAAITIFIIIIFQSTSEAIAKQNLMHQYNKEAVAINLSLPHLPFEQSRRFELASPDIYYIILDGYGNSEMLNKYFELDISPFEGYLTENGFYISEKSNSNYSLTKLSLSSSLNMLYMDSVAKQMGNSSSNTVPLIQFIQNNILIEFLRNRGYKISSFESGYDATEITSVDLYFNPKNTLTAFHSEIINLTPLRLWLSDIQYQTQRKRIKYIFDQLPYSTSSEHPVFVFAHVPAPHPPFVFGPNGENSHSDIPYSIFDGNYITEITGKEEYKKKYKDQVIYLNKLLETTIDEILNQPGPKPIIIIQGDHGPASELNWQNIEESEIDERMGILNAYYFPDKDYSKLYDNITPVNTFRIILDQYFGTDLGLLDDRSYFSTLSQPYHFLDITEELNINQITD